MNWDMFMAFLAGIATFLGVMIPLLFYIDNVCKILYSKIDRKIEVMYSIQREIREFNQKMLEKERGER